MINVQIKQLPPTTPGGEPRAVTTKVFLREVQGADGYCRPLEPGEVVALEDDEARHALASLPYELEMTMNDATRPLYFRNADEAAMTSEFFNPNSAGRAEQAKQAMANMMEDAAKPENIALVEQANELAAREQAIRDREIELGIIEDPSAMEDTLDKELEDYEPSNNTLVPSEFKQELADLEQEGAEVAQPEMKRDQPAEPDQAAAETPAPRRRRRRAAA